MKPHRARILAMQAIFQGEFINIDNDELSEFLWIDYEVPPDEKKLARKLFIGVREHAESIDTSIKEYSKNWDFDRISIVNRAILRISIYQLEFMVEEMPGKVVIDEAVRLAREFAEEDSGRFINGILDAYYKDGLKNREK